MCGHASGVHFKRKSVSGVGRALVCSDLGISLGACVLPAADVFPELANFLEALWLSPVYVDIRGELLN